MNPVEFPCRKCKIALGESTGRGLVIGNALFERNVTMRCRRCGRENKWVPASRPATNPASVSPGPLLIGAVIHDSLAEAGLDLSQLRATATPPRRDKQIHADEQERDRRETSTLVSDMQATVAPKRRA